jgi:hypothetical protein
MKTKIVLILFLLCVYVFAENVKTEAMKQSVEVQAKPEEVKVDAMKQSVETQAKPEETKVEAMKQSVETQADKTLADKTLGDKTLSEEDTTLESPLEEVDTNAEVADEASESFIQGLEVDTPVLGETPNEEDLAFIENH